MHTQHFAALPTVTKSFSFFFHFKNKIKTLSTIYPLSLSFFKPSSKASRVPFAHATFRGLTYSYKFFFSIQELNQNFINNLSTEPLLFLNHHQKPVAFLFAHATFRSLTYSYKIFFLFLFFHFKNKIKTLSTIYQPNLSFFKPSSKASRVPFAHATFRGLTYSYKIFFLLLFFHFENKIKTLSTTYQPSRAFFNHHQKTNAYPFAHATFRGLIHGYKNELMHKAVPSQTNFLN